MIALQNFHSICNNYNNNSNNCLCPSLSLSLSLLCSPLMSLTFIRSPLLSPKFVSVGRCFLHDTHCHVLAHRHVISASFFVQFPLHGATTPPKAATFASVSYFVSNILAGPSRVKRSEFKSSRFPYCCHCNCGCNGDWSGDWKLGSQNGSITRAKPSAVAACAYPGLIPDLNRFTLVASYRRRRRRRRRRRKRWQGRQQGTKTYATL